MKDVTARLLTVLALTVVCVYSVAPTEARQEEMSFSLHDACPGSGCDSYVLAQGVISERTPEAFVAFMKKIDWMPRVYFDSVGGDLSAGMRVGRLIRQRGLDTRVGGPYHESTGALSAPKVIVRKPQCLSACAYAFLGGVGREVAADSSIGVHQFRGVRASVDEGTAQAMVAVIALYLDEMGIDRRLLDVASITPGDDIATLTRSQARQLYVDNMNPPPASWEAKTDADGHLRACILQPMAGRSGAIQWCVVRGSTGSWIGSITYTIYQAFRPEPEVVDALNTRINGLRLYRPGDFAHGVRIGQIDPWRRIGRATYTTTVDLNGEALELLQRELTVEFDGDVAHAYRDVDPSVPLSLEGLAPLLKAIERQRP